MAYYAEMLNVNDNTLTADFWAGEHYCPICKSKQHFHLKHTTARFSLLFIGIIPLPLPRINIIDDRYILCDKCGFANKLTIHEYSTIRNLQLRSMASLEFPKEIIEEDFVPNKTKFGYAVRKSIFAGIPLLLVLLFGILLILSISEPSGIPSAILMPVLIAIPFGLKLIFALRYLGFCNAKRNAYKSAQEYPPLASFDGTQLQQTVQQMEILVLPKGFEEYLETTKSVMPESAVPTNVDASSQIYEKKLSEIAESGQEVNFVSDMPADSHAEDYKVKKYNYKFSALSFTVPKDFPKHKELHSACSYMAGKKHMALLVWQYLFIVFGLLCLIAAIVGSAMEAMFGTMLFLAFAVMFNIINRRQMTRIIESLYTLERTGNIQYLGEVIPAYCNSEKKFVFSDRLFYDRASRIVTAYDDIRLVYPKNNPRMENAENSNNNDINVIYLSTVDGSEHPSEINIYTFLEATKDKQNYLVGYSVENQHQYQSDVFDFHKKQN
ncbi:MAG: hypothetical protein E7600_05140 [Ruminococcaceae bacterium]|nr:hypothetical protein [Oscillospiraceae bacterium]